MYFNVFIIALPLIGIATFFLTWIFVRVFLWYFSWYLSRKYQITFKVKVGLLSLNQLSINLPSGGSIKIEHIWISSCILASNCRSLIALCFTGVKSEIVTKIIKNKPKPSEINEINTGNTSFFPPFLLLITKILSFKIFDFELIQKCVDSLNQPHILQTSLKEFGVIFNASNSQEDGYELCTSLSGAYFKLFKSESNILPKSYLFSFGITLECAMQLKLPSMQPIQKLDIQISNPEVVIAQGFKPDTLATIFNLQKNQSSPKTISESSETFLPSNQTIEDYLGNIIPKVVLAKIEAFDLKWVQSGFNRTLAVSLQTVDFELHQMLMSPDSNLTSSFIVQNVSVSSGQLPLASLVKSSVKLKVDNRVIDSNIQLSSLHLCYNYNELHFWSQILFPVPRTNKKEITSKKSKSLWPLLKDYKIQGQTDINDVFACVNLPACATFSAGLMHSQLTFDFICSVDGPQSKILGGLGEINLELLLEMAWCTLGDGRNINITVLKRHHQWNTPLCLGMLLLKARDFPSDFRIQSMVDGIKTEISPQFISLLKQLHHFSNANLHSKSKPKNESETLKKSRKTREMCSLQFSLTGANIFMLSEHGIGLMGRIDSITLDTTTEKIFFISEGLKVMPIEPSGTVFPCLKSSEVRHSLAYIQTVRLTYKINQKDMALQLLDEVKVQWTTSAHMCAVNLANEVKELVSLIKQTASQSDSDYSEPIQTSYLNTIKLQGKINIGFIMSKTHKFCLIGSEFTAKSHPGRIAFESDHLGVEFDDLPIFTFANWNISSVREDEGHVVNRPSFDGLERKYNKAWSVNIEELKMTFPYQYKFAEAYSEQAVSVMKWLKKVHKVKKKPFDINSPLPADMSIKIKLFTLDIADDPFEVKLRDNYELLEDEFNESLKRRMMLDDKIEKLRKTHLLLPTGKVEELYITLSKKNADIYIQRSKQLYGSSSMRTSLFSVQMENIELFAIADTSYHGRDRVLQVMQEIDPDSPFPEEGLEFNTLWCRRVNGSMQGISFHLRDFPQALLEIREFNFWGRLIGAEQEASKRAVRDSTVEIESPWGNETVERSMPSLKFYHDLTWDMESLCAAHGPCWEPVMAQVGLSFEYLSKPSADPSPVLLWWDKMRLMYHGRLTLSVQNLTMLLQASLNPFNTTEQMEITWTNVLIDWTNAKITMKGDLDIYVHTASKYDDCRLLHVPNVKLSFKLEWLCLGNPDDHHNVMPCAPDKIPEYSSNQVHDSFRAFRSQNLNISVAMETKPVSLETLEDVPCMLLYSSTLRWIENLKLILSGTSRPTRRGVLFNNVKPRKLQLGRHYRILRLSLNLHKFRVCYWMSFAKQQGFELLGGRFSLGSEHTLALKPVDDGLKHRPRADWSTAYLTCDLVESEIWLYNKASNADGKPEDGKLEDVKLSVRSYFVSMTRVSYGRETVIIDPNHDNDIQFTHRLVVHGLRGAWTISNRDVVFNLSDSYTKSKQMKRNLSTDALKGLKMDNQFQRSRSHTSNSNSSQPGTNTASPITRLQSGHMASMLQKLISEAAEANTMVFIEELDGNNREQQLHGVSACQMDDVLRKNWLIELVNSQVMLKGSETSGYIIVSAARTEILQRAHNPVWKERSLVSKTTWVGSVECLQYYATVDGGSKERNPFENNSFESNSFENIMWLSVDNIEEKPSVVISDLPDLVGSGHSVGGVVSNTVGGAADPGSAPLQLQRIVSRCGCHFYYASYGENMDTEFLGEAPPLPDENDPWEPQGAVDSFTLTHHDLTVCTNFMQYAMILDIINHVLLYVEPLRKKAFDKLQNMKFKLQLSTTEDQKGPILELQNQVRNLSLKLRRLERETYQVHRALDENGFREDLQQQNDSLKIEFDLCKTDLLNVSEELNMMINCYRETQVSDLKTRQKASVQNQSVTPIRRSEVCFKYAQWRLTDADGQLGIADFTLSNFLYSKLTRSDDSVEHLLELGHIKVTNLLPNQVYKDVLRPTELQPNIPLDRQRALRIFCRERAPVGGISVKEHFEVNVIPITIGLTHTFFTHMMKFFFPGRYTVEKTDGESLNVDESSSSKSKKRTTLGPKNTSAPVNQDNSKRTTLGQRNTLVNQDDISKMRERAEKNQTFLYIKIPEVPLRVSYKGGKEKNIEDLHECNLNLHTLEYHNRTWTWLDLLMEMKNDSQKALLQQAIKQKLQIKSRTNNTDDSNQPLEEDKARLLLGTKLVGGPEKSSKKGGIFGRSGK